jgi:MerR family transcriptional regulator, copper efflux regulator
MRSSEVLPGEAGGLTIGDLASRFGVATHVLRHWEAAGLLTPARHANGRRLYRYEDVVRVVIIMLGKATGFSLDQLRTLLDVEADGPARQVMLAGQYAELERRVAQAQTSMALIAHALDCDAEDFTRCPHFLTELTAHISDDPSP